MKLALCEDPVKNDNLADKLQEGLWVADSENRIVFANHVLARHLGYDSPDLLIGKIWYELFPFAKAARAGVQKLANITTSQIFNHTRTQLPLVTTIVTKTMNNSIVHFGSVFLPQEYSQSDLIAMVSHELRTPLAAINEALSLFAETAAGQLEEPQRRYLNIAREEIDRLSRMISNLIEASRMEMGKVVLNLKPVNLNQLVNTAIQSLSFLINRKNLEIELHTPGKLPLVLGDSDRLLQVLNNLLDNAIKYSPEGGVIRIDIGFVEPNTPILAQEGILANTDYLQISITDRGPGIPRQFLEKIFGRYERIDPSGPGIGLGLAIVRSIIERHHGKVWANSVVGEGASFSFILPTREEVNEPRNK